MNKALLFLVVTILLVAAGSVGYIVLSGKLSSPSDIVENDPNSPVVEPGEEPASGLIIGGNAVLAADQVPGTTALVTLAVLENPGYVVIHRVDDDGKPGQIIGNSELLQAGEHKNIEIALSEDAEEGNEFFAMLHSDDGNGTYEFPGPDGPITDQDGNVVMMKYVINSEAIPPADAEY